MSLPGARCSRIVMCLSLGLVLVWGCPGQEPVGRPAAEDSSCDPVAASADCPEDEACYFDLDELASSCQAESGTGTQGDACQQANECADGYSCILQRAAVIGRECAFLCDASQGGGPACADGPGPGLTCVAVNAFYQGVDGVPGRVGLCVNAAPGAVAECGNGSVEEGEDCDTGGDSQSCDADCTSVTCGDGTANSAAGEACDDGGESATCDADCTAVVCGDGTTNALAGEECDDGGPSAACAADCTLVACGNGVVDAAASEECDDGGESATCDTDCTTAVCGDGTTNAMAGEACDDSGQSAMCDADCTSVACGDGTLNVAAGEACDDGMNNSDTEPDACRTSCVEPGCGDGVIDTGEGCDPPDGGACDEQCQRGFDAGCDPLGTPTGCPVGESCFVSLSFEGTFCASSVASSTQGDECLFLNACADGFSCVLPNDLQTANVCAFICDATNSGGPTCPDCPGGLFNLCTCIPINEFYPDAETFPDEIGMCVPR